MVLFGGPELFSFNRKGFLRNLEKTKKPKKQNFLEKFWFQVKDVFFWFSLSFLFFFLFRFLKTKKNLGFFGFLKEVLLEERQKTKKTQGFFGFLVRCLEYMYGQSMKKPKKNLEFFWFFALLQVRLPSKNQKNPRFFWFLRI